MHANRRWLFALWAKSYLNKRVHILASLESLTYSTVVDKKVRPGPSLEATGSIASNLCSEGSRRLFARAVRHPPHSSPVDRRIQTNSFLSGTICCCCAFQCYGSKKSDVRGGLTFVSGSSKVVRRSSLQRHFGIKFQVSRTSTINLMQSVA
jgi:hypothetical protein